MPPIFKELSLGGGFRPVDSTLCSRRLCLTGVPSGLMGLGLPKALSRGTRKESLAPSTRTHPAQSYCADSQRRKDVSWRVFGWVYENDSNSIALRFYSRGSRQPLGGGKPDPQPGLHEQPCHGQAFRQPPSKPQAQHYAERSCLVFRCSFEVWLGLLQGLDYILERPPSACQHTF